MKITVPGDLMIEPPVLKYAKRSDGSYDFREIFKPTEALFKEADLLLGNLETPLAGEEAKYTQHYYAFNAPDSYADAVKQAGFHMVSTANNHTFDRGFEGAERTLDVLDAKGIGHHGSARKGEAHREAWYTTVGDTKIAVVAYTYGTNFSGSGLGCLAEGEHAGMVNLLRPQKETVYQPGVFRGPDWVDKLFSFLQAETRGRIKKYVGLDPNYPRADDRLDKKTMAPYVARFQADIRKAKENADFVIFMPHVGGQFNLYPGAVSEYVVDKALEAGADAVLAGHSHMVQRGLLRKGVPCFYSLGNFNMDPTSSLMLPEVLPQYGLAVHLYVEDKKLEKTTFSVIKMVRRDGKQICPQPVDELYETLDAAGKAALEKDVRQILETVNEQPPEGAVIRREYPLTNIWTLD